MPDERMRLGFSRPTPVVFATLVVLVAMYVVGGLSARFSETGRALYEQRIEARDSTTMRR